MPSTKSKDSTKGRKPATDKAAPHGRDEATGEPLAPYGWIGEGEERRPRITKLIDTEIDLDVIANPFTPPQALQRDLSPKHARSERQSAMDAIVTAAHQAWLDGGSKNKWDDLPTRLYSVPPDKAEGIRTLVKRSADFLGFRPRFGSPTLCDPEKCPTCALVAESVMARAQEEGETNPDVIAERVGASVGGHELIVFAIVDKAAKKEEEKAAA